MSERMILAPEITVDGEPGRTVAGLHFDAVLYPHRALGPRGFIVLMASVTGVSFIAGLAFFVMGAWPVVGFFGLDVALIYIALKVNYRAGRIYETVQLDDSALLIRRHLPDGRILSWNFQPYWARVELLESAPAAPLLAVRSHGKYLIFGKFLSEEERLEFAKALRGALVRHRNKAPLAGVREA